MAQYVNDCPRCNVQRTTIDVKSEAVVSTPPYRVYEVFCICRACRQSTVFILEPKSDHAAQAFAQNKPSASSASLESLARCRGYVNTASMSAEAAPEHLPPLLQSVFDEGAKCLAIGCYNASGTMFRLCVDLATSEKLPSEGTPDGPSGKQRRDLGLRLPWLFANNLLPNDLHDLASCIKDDGNDGAHRGTLQQTDAQDLLDFTRALLESLYTLPMRRKLAADRRDQRRNPGG